nr:ABC transporter substrate-binding protein [Streptomyces hainanensis]
MRDQGWLEEALPEWDIEWTRFDSGATINTAFVAESVDLAAIGSSPVARGLSAPLNIPYQVAWVLDVAGENEALVAREGAGIESMADLEGRTVGVPFASTAHYSLLAALDQAGVEAAAVEIVDLEPQDIVAAWTRGDLDASYVWLPTLDELRATGQVLATSEEIAAAGKPTLDLGVASTELVEEHPEVIAAWRDVQARALNLIHDDPDAAAEAVGRQLGIDADVAAAQLEQGVFLRPDDQSNPQWLGTPDRIGEVAANLHDAAEFLAAQNQIEGAPDLTVFQDAVHAEGLSDVDGS